MEMEAVYSSKLLTIKYNTTAFTCSCVVGTATRYGLDDLGFEFRQETREFSLLKNHPDRLWGLSSLQFQDYSVSFQGVKRPGREAYPISST